MSTQTQQLFGADTSASSYTFSIYVLMDPRNGIVRYVGKSKNAIRRLPEHIQRSASSSRKDVWIRELLQQGLRPELSILEAVEDSDKANEREQYWIEFYSQKETLFNYNHNTQSLPQDDRDAQEDYDPILRTNVLEQIRRERERYAELKKTWEVQQ